MRVQAFLCGQPRKLKCGDLPRGLPIPRDSLPPATEAFQVWAWHPGTGKMVYRLGWQSAFFVGDGSPVAPKQTVTELDSARDSASLSYNFASAPRTRYVLNVMFLTPTGKIADQDSLVWDFTRGTAPQPPRREAAR